MLGHLQVCGAPPQGECPVKCRESGHRVGRLCPGGANQILEAGRVEPGPGAGEPVPGAVGLHPRTHGTEPAAEPEDLRLQRGVRLGREVIPPQGLHERIRGDHATVPGGKQGQEQPLHVAP